MKGKGAEPAPGGTRGPAASRHRLPPAAILIPAAALLAGFLAAAPYAHADSHPLTAEITNGTASPTSLAAVPFNMTFSGGVNATTIDESDIAVSSGTVQGLRMVLRYNSTIGEHGTSSADDGKFKRPFGLAANGSGYLYVAERAGKRIQVFDPAGEFVAKFGGLATDFDNPEPGKFRNIYGIAADASSGRIYTADSLGNRTLIYESDGEYVADLTHPGISVRPHIPIVLAVNGTGHVYVADNGNNTVQIFDSSGRHVAALDGAFNGPRGLAFDGPAGLVYVADRENDRIRVFDLDGMPVRDIGSSGTGTGQFDQPIGVAVDELAGRIYVTEKDDNQRVQVFDAGWNHVSYLSGFPNVLRDPRAIAVDVPSGRVYVADTENHRVLVFDAAYEFSVANPADRETLTVSLPDGSVRDAAGNGNAESNTASVEIDRTAPKPIVTSEQESPTGAVPIGFRVNFGEPVDGFGEGDITLSGTAPRGGVANFETVNASTYDFKVAPTGDGTIQVDIPAGAALDRAKNPSVAADRFSVEYVDGPPTAIITSTQASPTNAPAISFQVTFSEPVDGFVAADIELSGNATLDGGVKRFAGSGASYTFDVTPTGDGLVVVDVPAGAALDRATTPKQSEAAPRLAIEYDPTPPAPAVTAAQSSPTNASAINFRVDFTERVDGFNASGIVLSGTAPRGGAANFATVNASAYTFDVSPTSDGTVVVGIPEGAAADAAGNPSTAVRFSVAYDVTGPAPAVGAAVTGPTNLAAVPFNMTFSENINATTLDESDITVSSGTVQGLRMVLRYNSTIGEHGTSSADDGKFKRPFGLAVNGSGYLYVAERAGKRIQVFDPAGEFVAKFGGHSSDSNPGPGLFNNIYGIAADASSGRIYAADSVGSRTLIYESDGEYVADLTHPGNSVGPHIPIVPAVNGTGHVYVADNGNSTVQIFDPAGKHVAALDGTFNGPRGLAFDGPAGLVYVADRENDRIRVFDLDGMPVRNIGASGTGTGQFDQPIGIAVDELAGRIYVTEKDDNQRVQVFDSNWGHVSYLSGFPNVLHDPRAIAVDVPSGRAYVADTENHRVLVFDAAYEFSVANPADRETLTVRVQAGSVLDGAGNANEESNTTSIEIDRTAPKPIVTSEQGNTAGTATINFRVNFGEPVDGFGEDDITLSGADTSGGVDNFATVNASAYTFDVTLTGDGTIRVDIPEGAALDRAKNPSAAADRFSVEYVDGPPTAIITSTQASPTNASAISFQVTFSDPVTQFDSGDVLLTGNATHGGVENFAGRGALYAFEVTPTGDGLVVVDVPAGAAQDTANKPSEAAPRLTIEYDPTPPAPTATAAQSSPTNASAINFRVDFTEPVDGFEAGDVALTGTAPRGGVANFATVNASAYTFDVSPASDGTVVVGIPEGAAADAAGNPSTAVRFSVAYDVTGPAPAVGAAVAGPTNLAAVPFNMTFSENINATTLDESDITVSSGTVQGLRMVLRYNSTIGTDGVRGSEPGELNRPFGLAVNSSGYLYVAERAGKRIQVFDPAGESVATFGGLATNFDDPEPGRFRNLYGLAADASSGRIYAADSAGNRTLIYEHDGEYLADLAHPGISRSHIPIALAVNGTGHVYVAYTGNNTVQIFDSSRKHVAALAGTFDSPHGVAFNASAGLVYAADTNNDAILVFDLDGMPAGSFGASGDGPGQLSEPIGIAVDELAGRIYVTEKEDNQRVQVFDSDWDHVSYLSGFPLELRNPRAIAVDVPSGRAYVADTENHRVLVFDAAYEFSVANPDDRETLTVSLPAGSVLDGAGNANEESNTASIEIDRTAPKPTVTSTQASPTNAATIRFLVNFSDPVDGFDADDVLLSGNATLDGGVKRFSGEGALYTFEVTPTGDGLIHVDIGAGAAQDGATNPSEAAKRLTIEYDDEGPTPVVTSTQASPTNAAAINFKVNFTDPVTMFDADDVLLSGNATLDGGVKRFSGEGALYTFEVTPTGDGLIHVDIPAGAAQDGATNPSEAAKRLTIEYDDEGPTPVVTAVQASPTNAAAINFKVNFSDPVDGFDADDVLLSGNATLDGGVKRFSGEGALYTFEVTPTGDGLIHVDIPAGAAQDGATNPSEAAKRFTIEYDDEGPTPVVTSTQASPTNAAAINFKVNFSDPVDGFDADDVLLSGNATLDGGVKRFSGEGALYTFEVTPTGDGLIHVDIPAGAAQDGATNPSEAAKRLTIEYDDEGPTPVVTAVQASPTNAAAINFKVNFSDPVDGFDADDVLLSGNATLDGGVKGFSGEGALYTFEVTPTGDGLIHVDIPAGAAQDGATNPSEAAKRLTIEYDDEGPTPVVTAVQASPTNAATINFKVNFTDPVTMFDADDVLLTGNATLDGGVKRFSGEGALYTFEVTPTGDGLIHVDIGAGAAQDRATNPSEAAQRLTIEYDDEGPTPVVTSTQASPTNAATINFKVNFTDPVTMFDADDVLLTGNATLDGGVKRFSGEGALYTFEVTPTGDGLIHVDIPAGAAQDRATNPSEAAKRLTIEYDSTPLIPITTSTQASPTNAATINFKVNFTDPVTTFDADDVLLTGNATLDGGVKRFSGEGALYRFEVTPTGDGLIHVDIRAGAALDVADNPSLAAARFTMEYDPTPPLPTITATQPDPTNASTINLRVEFGESVDGFEAEDVRLSGDAGPGPAANLAGSGASYTFDATTASDGTILVDMDAGAAQDAAGNPSREAARFSIARDSESPIPAFAPAEPGPTNLRTVPFAARFSEAINASTLDASDIDVTSGTVGNLRMMLQRSAAFGENGTGAGRLLSPYGVAIDGPAGRIYVADSGNSLVKIFNSTTNAYISNVPVSLASPYGVAVDGPTGRVYAAGADGAAGRVQIFDSATGAHATDLPGPFSNPFDVAPDGSSDRVYVADTSNNRTRVFDSDGNRLADLPGPFSYPAGVAVDSRAGRVYVSNSGNDTVQVFNSTTGAHVDDLPGPFDVPYGVAVDSRAGRVYVADSESNRTLIFDSGGNRLADLPGTFNKPRGVAVDPHAGRVYVADTGNHSIQIFDTVYTFDVADPDNLQTLNVSMRAGRVQDAAGNANGASDAAGIRVDRTAPFPTITAAQEDPTNSPTINFRVNFTEHVTEFGAGDVLLTGNASIPGGVENFTGGDNLYTFHVTPAGDGLIHVDINAGAALDAALNPSAAADRLAIEYDPTPPFPTITAAQEDPTNSPTINFRVNFTEHVTEFGAGDVLLTGNASIPGGVENFTGEDNLYTFHVTPAGDGLIHVDINAGAALDAALNPSAAADRLVIEYDPTPPFPTITAAQEDPTNSPTINFRVNFTEHVTEFGAGDVLLTGNASIPGGVENFTGEDNLYTFHVTPAGDGLVVVDINAGAALDAALNPSAAADRLVIEYDPTPPFPTITAAQEDPTNSPTINFRVNFTEHVTEFGAGDVLLTGNASIPGGVENFTGGNNLYTFHVTPAGDGLVVVDINAGAALDAALNPSAAADRLVIEYDPTPPFPTITAAQEDPTNSPTINFRVNFTEHVTEFGAGDVLLTGNASIPGGVENFTGGNNLYTFHVTPAGDGLIHVDINAGAALDAALNPSAAADRLAIEYDPTPPFPTITAAQEDPTNSPTINFRVNFTEHVTEFGAGDVLLTGNASIPGGVENFTGGNNLYTFHVTPAGDGLIHVDINAGAALDAALNPSAAADRLAIEYDPTPPFPTITAAQEDPTNSPTINFRVNFTEHVTEFGAGDVLLTGNASIPGGVENFTGEDNLYTFHVTPAGDGLIHVDINAGAALDAALNPSAAADRLAIEYDPTPPFPTITAAQEDPTNSPTINFRVNFTEHVTEFGAGDVLLTGNASIPGGVENFTGGNNLYTFHVTPAGDGLIHVDINAGAALDAALNPSAAADRLAIEYDPTPPFPTITAAQEDPTNSPTINFRVNFTEHVTEFGAGDVLLTGNASIPGGVENFTGGNNLYTFHVTPAGDGLIHVDINAGAALDAALNPSAAADRLAIEYDPTPPFPTITAAQEDPTNSPTINFRVNFTEHVTEFGAGDVLLTGNASIPGGVENFTGEDNLYTFHVTPAGDGLVVVDINAGAALDAALNPSAAADRLVIEYDPTPPFPTITAAQEDPTNSPTINFRVNFTEHVTEFGAGDVLLTGNASIPGGVENFTGGNNLYTFHVTPAGDGLIHVDINAGAALDAALNPSAAADRLDIEYDGTQPAPTFTAMHASPTNTTTVQFALKFDENIDGSTLDASDISASSGEVQGLSLPPHHGPAFGEEGTGPGQFRRTFGVAADGSSGLVYVTDRANKRIQVFDFAGTYVAEFGELGTGPGQFSNPYGLATDASSGSVYVADSVGHRVLVFDSDREYVADLPGPFNSPVGLAANASGHVYVSNSGNGTVQIFNSSGNYAADLPINFSSPGAVAVDASSGHVYVADRNNGRIHVFDSAGMPVAGFGTNGSGTGQLNRPDGVAVDGSTGRIYVAERGNHRVQVFGSDMEHASYLPGTFNSPRGVAVDPASGRVYVADTENHRVQVFDTAYAFSVANPDDRQTLNVSMPAGSVRDAAGNWNKESDTAGIEIDRTAPIPTVTSAQRDPTNSPTISFQVNFAEPVTLFGADDVNLSGNATHGGVANFTGEGALYEFDVSPTRDGMVRVDINASAARDAAGNPSEAAKQFPIEYDPTPPFPTITVTQEDPTNATTINFQVNFSEPVTLFNSSDIVLSGNASLAGDVHGFTGGNDTYAFFVTPTDDGMVRVDVPSGAARDAAGNPSEAADQLAIEYDGTATTLTINATQASPTNAATINFRVNFSEPVTLFDSGDIALSGNATLHGGVENFTGGNDLYAFNVTPAGDGLVRVDVNPGAAQDAAGNPTAAADQFVIEYDSTPPFPTITAAQEDPTNSQTIRFQVNFTEHVTMFDADDVVLSGNASLAGAVASPADGGASYGFGVTPAGDGAILVNIPAGAALDAATNPSEAAERFSIRYDGTPPTPTFTAMHASPTNMTTVQFALEFGENIDGSTLAASDISASSGTVGDPRAAQRHNSTFGEEGTGPGQFRSPSSMAVDGSSGLVYVADTANGRVQVFNSAGEHVATFGENGTGQLAGPVGVAVDGSSGRVYVADSNGSRVQVFGSGGEHATGLPGPFNNSAGLAVNASGHVYVANSGNNTVQIFDSSGNWVGDLPINFSSPGAVAADGFSGHVYVADSGDGTVQVFDSSGKHVAGFGGHGSGQGQLGLPVGLAVDGSAGLVYVAERGNGRVQVFDSDGSHVSYLPGPFDGPRGLAVDVPSGRVYVADPGNHSVRVFDTAYAFNVTDPANEQTLNVTMPAGSVRDAAGNANEESDTAGIEIDRTAPKPIVTAMHEDPTNATTIRFQVNFTERVSGFNASDVLLSGNATNATDSGGVKNLTDENNFAGENNLYTFEATPANDGLVLVDVPAGAALDAALNPSTAAERFSMEYDGTAPIPVINATQASPTSAATINFHVKFGEPVDGFGAADIILTGNASLDGGVASADGGASYEFDVNPAGDGTIRVDIGQGAAQDKAGNPSEAAKTFSIEYDGSAPFPTINATQASPTNAATINFQVRFSENVTGFEPGGIVLSGAAAPGSAANFAGEGDSYTFDVTPAGDGAIDVRIPPGAARNAAGINNTAATFSIVYDGTAPFPTINATQASPTSAATINFQVRFSEPVDGFGAAGVRLTGDAAPGAAENFAGGGDSYAFDVTPAGDGTIRVDIPAGAAQDKAGNPSSAARQFSITRDTAAALLLEAATLDLTAGANGRLVLEFSGAATVPDARSFRGEIVIRGGSAAAALSAADIPSVASGRAGGTEFALDISGAKRVELNGADLGSATLSLPDGFVSDALGRPYAGGGSAAVPLAHVQDPSPPRLAKAAFNLAPGSGNAGRLVITFDEAATAPGAQSFPGTIEIRGRSWGGDAAVSLSAADMLSVESGSTGDRTFVLLVSDRVRAALDAAAFSVPESTTLLLPAGIVTNGRAAHAPERAPLDVARDPDRPSFLLAFVLDGSSIAAVYSEPVLAVPSHYTNITVGGAAAAGNGSGASGAAAFGNNVVVSWNANASTTASAGSAVGFDLSANVTDAFGNQLENPGTKSTGGPDGTGQAGKRPVQVGVFARGAADPSAEAARLGAAAFNAVSSERGYQFYVSVSEHDLPAGASGAAALRGAHNGGEGPSLYVGPASDIALAGMAGYASENGITIISHSSAARSLAVGGDPIFRMEPGAAHLARALATEVARGGYGAIVPVVQAGLRGPDYGLLESLESDLGPLGIPVGEPVAFAAGGGGEAAAPIETAVAAAAGSGTARSVAVVYVGSDAELVAMAGSVPAGGPVRERSAWFAAGGAGAGAGSGVAASPAITADAAAMQLARDTRLSAVQFAVERNSMTDYIDRIAAPRGPAASATPAYAAYEAVRALGGALVGAGGDPSLARGNVAGAANLEGGPLGRTGMDGNGDLRLPVTYGIWSVSDVSAEWARAPELLLGLDACGIDLEKSALALPELSAGSTSRPARQTVTNIGTGPMPAVSVSATDWAQFLNGVPLPGPLPFSYTEMAVGLDGASPRPADSTPLAAGTEIPGGTPPGGSVDVDFRINLEDLDALEADIISQTVTFVANCA